MSDISESVKKNCFEEMGVHSHHRNIMSYCLFGISNLGMIALGAMKISHPLIPIGFAAINGVAHFLKTSGSSTKQKELIQYQHNELRRLSFQELAEMSQTKTSIDKKKLSQTQEKKKEEDKKEEIKNDSFDSNNVDIVMEGSTRFSFTK